MTMSQEPLCLELFEGTSGTNYKPVNQCKVDSIEFTCDFIILIHQLKTSTVFLCVVTNERRKEIA